MVLTKSHTNTKVMSSITIKKGVSAINKQLKSEYKTACNITATKLQNGNYLDNSVKLLGAYFPIF